MKTILAAAMAAGLLLAGCAGTGTQRTSSEAELLTASATVQSVDQEARSVTLVGDAEGETFTVFAGDEIPNLAQIEPGDQVVLEYYQSVTLAMADPADSGVPITTVAGGTAAEGERPGGVAVESTSLVVQLVNYDAASGLATYVTPDGITHRSTVPPSLRSFAATLGRGSRVLVTMTEAVAVSITEAV